MAMKRFTQFWRREDAAVAIEYAIIGSMIALLIVAGASAIGTKLSARFQSISSDLS